MIWYSQEKSRVSHHEINLIDMIPLAKDDLWGDQLHSSMNLREIHIPNLNLMQDVCMKMNGLKNIIKSDHK